MKLVQQYLLWTGHEWKKITQRKAGILIALKNVPVKIGEDFFGVQTLFLEKSPRIEFEVLDLREIPVQSDDERDVVEGKTK